ncbi:MAG TPA: DMT family transporter [Bdellovibrionota bacterium]|nr:DMT family transporter [Bdellovibrionota bacterium]
MTLSVFFAVLGSAFFQASWNFAAKRSRADKISLLAVGWFLFGVLFLPFAFLTFDYSQLALDWVVFMTVSGAIHGVYLCLLGWGYTIGEISVIYPVARGLGIVGTTIGALALGMHGLSPPGFAGVSAVVLGTLLIGMREVPKRERRMAFFAAVLIALSVSAYSLVDSLGAKRVPIALYLAGSLLLAPVFASPFLLVKMRKEMAHALRNHKLEALLVAAAGSLAYGIILWAYQRTSTAYVAALREFSVVIAAGLGVVILEEQMYKRKALAVVLILAGVVLIKGA